MVDSCPLCHGEERYQGKCRRCMLTIDVLFSAPVDDMSVREARERVFHLEKNTDLYKGAVIVMEEKPELLPLENADLSLVELREAYGKLYPHCKLHGAMNMVKPEGWWRCLAEYGYRKRPTPLKEDGTPRRKENPPEFIDTICRAGCIYKESDSHG